MDWFYAVNDERKGPVTDAQLPALISSGKILRDTLVWNQSMTDWKPAGQTSLFPLENPAASPTPPVLRPGEHICVITGKSFPASQMLKTEHGWVSVEGKDVYYQSLREGAPIPLANGQSNARADGKRIVVPILNGKLPMRCVKTNQPVFVADLKNKKLYWCHPAVFLALLLNILVLLVLYFVLRKKIVLDIPVSSDGRRLVAKATLVAWAIFIGGLALMIGGIVLLRGSAGSAPFLIVGGIVILLLGIIYCRRKTPLLRVVRIKNGHAWLAGACKDYVASLPSYPS